jgi:hypothetical protein
MILSAGVRLQRARNRVAASEHSEPSVASKIFILFHLPNLWFILSQALAADNSQRRNQASSVASFFYAPTCDPRSFAAFHSVFVSETAAPCLASITGETGAFLFFIFVLQIRPETRIIEMTALAY